MTQKRKDLVFALVVTFLFAWAAFYILQFHEPWMDEAQAWLVARDNGFGGIINQMSFEGQPPLWHFLLYPLAHLGLPIESMQVFHVLISTAAVFLMMRFGPFTKPFKLLFASSYMMFYEYTIVARSYSLTVLLLFLIASFYEKRFEKPWVYTLLIALLAWSNNLGLLCAAALGVIFLIESLQTKKWKGRIYYMAGMVAAGASAWYVSILKEGSFFNTYGNDTSLVYHAINQAFFIPTLFPDGFIGNLAPALVFLMIISFLKTPKSFLFLLLTFNSLMYILVFQWSGGFRHWTFMLILFVFTYWISSMEGRDEWKHLRNSFMDALTGDWGRKMGLAILLTIFFISSSKTVLYSTAEIEHPYSNGKSMGEYISTHASDVQLAGYNAGEITSILPYIPQKEIYYIQFQEWGSYQTQSSHYGKNAKLDINTLLSRINGEFGEERPWLILTDQLERGELPGYEYVHEELSPAIGDNQEYFVLYRPI